MRKITLLLSLSAVFLAACGQGGDTAPDGSAPAAASSPAASGLPSGPTPGLWRVTTQMSGMPAGMAPPAIETCIREAKLESPTGPMSRDSNMQCGEQSFRREGDAMVAHMVCTSAEGVRTVVDTRVSGDFSRAYTMEIKSTTTPAPAPAMAEMTMVMSAERIGDCPAGSPAQ